MVKIRKVKYIKAPNLDNLAEQVTNHTKKGWYLHGNIVEAKNNYIQTICIDRDVNPRTTSQQAAAPQNLGKNN